MYCLSFTFLAGQYIYGDVFGITLTSFLGTPIRSTTLEFIETGTLNEIATETLNVNATTDSALGGIERAFTIGWKLALEIFQLITGTYIFNLLYLFDVPDLMIVGIVAVYFILGLRALISYIRNG